MPSHSTRKHGGQPKGVASSAIQKTAKERSSELKKFKKDVSKFGVSWWATFLLEFANLQLDKVVRFRSKRKKAKEIK
jgi:hypothetical protein